MSFALLLLAILLLIISLTNFLTIKRPQASKQMTKSVDVLIPLRNEAHNVDGLISALKDQSDAPHARFILLNDNSTDETYELLRKAIGEDHRFDLLMGHRLPDGWLGKPWAMHQLLAHSKAEYVIFSDADVRFTSTAVSQGMGILLDNNLDFASPYPHQIAKSWIERLIQPLLHWSWMTTVPLSLAQRSSNPAFAVANGQFLIAKKSALDAIDGVRSISQSVLDDMDLARALIRSGAHGTVVDGSSIAATRMYSNAEELQAGYGKSLWMAFGGKLGTTFVISFLALTGILPLIGALAGDPLLLIVLELMIFTRVISAFISKGRILDAFLHPLSSAYLIYLIIYSWRNRGEITWKGRAL